MSSVLSSASSSPSSSRTLWTTSLALSSSSTVLHITILSSAYLTNCRPALSNSQSSSFRYIFASNGLLTPPCTNPTGVSYLILSCMYPAFRLFHIRSSTVPSDMYLFSTFISFLCGMLSKNPLISKSYT